MKVTYPHMGYLTIPVNRMLTTLGIDVVEAPPITKKTIELGALHSPEGVCLPYKINMGNFLEGIDRGANTLLSVCGEGKCRLGFYNAVQKIGLPQDKINNFYSINTSKNLFIDLYRCMRSLAPSMSRTKIIQSIIMAIVQLKVLDSLNEAKNRLGPIAYYPDDVINIYTSGAGLIGSCQSFGELRRCRNTVVDLMKAVTDECAPPPAKVGLIGEFYLLLEPYVNNNIENFLIKNGVEVKKFVYAGDWAYSQTLLRFLKLYDEEKAYLEQARPYLNYHVGGDGLKSVGSALWCAKNGYDGIIHIYPFGCMPEVVAQFALKNISVDYNIPLLALSIDEHSSDVGMQTRLEAFIDCIKRKSFKKPG